MGTHIARSTHTREYTLPRGMSGVHITEVAAASPAISLAGMVGEDDKMGGSVLSNIAFGGAHDDCDAIGYCR